MAKWRDDEDTVDVQAEVVKPTYEELEQQVKEFKAVLTAAGMVEKGRLQTKVIIWNDKYNELTQ